MSSPLIARAVGIGLGYLADRLWADPVRLHPVAGFGQAAGHLEGIAYKDSRLAGVAYASVLVGTAAAAGWAAEKRSLQCGSFVTILSTAVTTWSCLGGTSLIRVGEQMAVHLRAQDLTQARGLLPSLCGRDPACLDAQGLLKATVESVAENTSDAAVAPLFWVSVGGVPGIVAYRVINTLDAMVGYRSTRYVRFGWAAAKLDDVVNLVPARLCGLLTAVVAPAVSGTFRQTIRAWRRDAGQHPSPNAGVVESSMAGALGITLGGPTQYPYGLEIRPKLGSGPTPEAPDLERVLRLSLIVQQTSVVLSAFAAIAVGKFFRTSD
ncbi:MAG: cobalamin biosynthesis protein [Mycobacteriaceae bacterium]